MHVATIEALNELSDAWKAQFLDPEDDEAKAPDIPLLWSVKDDLVYIDDLPVYSADMIDPSSLDFDVEWLYMSTLDGFDITISINCPYEGKNTLLAVRMAQPE